MNFSLHHLVSELTSQDARNDELEFSPTGFRASLRMQNDELEFRQLVSEPPSECKTTNKSLHQMHILAETIVTSSQFLQARNFLIRLSPVSLCRDFSKFGIFSSPELRKLTKSDPFSAKSLPEFQKAFSLLCWSYYKSQDFTFRSLLYFARILPSPEFTFRLSLHQILSPRTSLLLAKSLHYFDRILLSPEFTSLAKSFHNFARILLRTSHFRLSLCTTRPKFF